MLQPQKQVANIIFDVFLNNKYVNTVFIYTVTQSALIGSI